MGGEPRYLWGVTKMDRPKITQYLDLVPQSSAPAASKGRMYLDEFGMVNTCVDGTNWASIFKLTPIANPPQPYKGRAYMDPSYKLRVCEDGSTFKTVTTS